MSHPPSIRKARSKASCSFTSCVHWVICWLLGLGSQRGKLFLAFFPLLTESYKYNLVRRKPDSLCHQSTLDKGFEVLITLNALITQLKKWRFSANFNCHLHLLAKLLFQGLIECLPVILVSLFAMIRWRNAWHNHVPFHSHFSNSAESILKLWES